MAKPPSSDKRLFRTVPIGAILPTITRQAYRAHGPALAQLLADWPELIGPALAAIAQPRRLSAATLTLGCAGPAALELQHVAAALVQRINGHYGRQVVQRIRFVHQPPAAVDGQAGLLRPVPRAATVGGIPDGPLRDALAALGGAVRAR